MLASGREIIMPSEGALKRTVVAAEDDEFNRAEDNWKAVRRVLDKTDPGYKT